MSFWRRLLTLRKKRERWEGGLAWFRLRYREPGGPTRCLALLSRPEACGRVALYHRPGNAVAQLYLGVPATHVRLLRRMAADFDLSLAAKPPQVTVPSPQRMVATATLPWEDAFVAHIVDETAFVSLEDGENEAGSYLPDPASGDAAGRRVSWRLPSVPPAGLTMQPSWNGRHPPDLLVARAPDSERWLLGRSQAGIPLHVGGPVNVYGRQEAVATWLAHLTTRTVTADPRRLIVVDGAGDLVPRLKRKAAVTRLLGNGLTCVDVDGAAFVTGFNPLASVPGEAKATTVQRWQRWFRGMNVHPQGVDLLAQAAKDGVGDIPSLQKWLKGAERRGAHVAVSGIGAALTRLTADRALREWLAWPTNLYEASSEGALFFSCNASEGNWARDQLLRAVLLGSVHVADVRLIVHGFPWTKWQTDTLSLPGQSVIGNGPLLAESTIVLTQSHPRGVTALSERFLDNDARLSENLALLGRGEGIVIAGGTVSFTTWNGRVGHGAGGEGRSC